MVNYWLRDRPVDRSPPQSVFCCVKKVNELNRRRRLSIHGFIVNESQQLFNGCLEYHVQQKTTKNRGDREAEIHCHLWKLNVNSEQASKLCTLRSALEKCVPNEQKG